MIVLRKFMLTLKRGIKSDRLNQQLGDGGAEGFGGSGPAPLAQHTRSEGKTINLNLGLWTNPETGEIHLVKLGSQNSSTEHRR